MSSPSALSPRTVSVLRGIGILWPEITAVAIYIAHMWIPILQGLGARHPWARGAAFVLLVYLAHQEVPLPRWPVWTAK